MFGRVAAEVVSRRDNRGVQFYGRNGQSQHGLDIVERDKSGSRSLYQVKRYTEITPVRPRRHRTADFHVVPPECTRHPPAFLSVLETILPELIEN